MEPRPERERVVLDASALLGPNRTLLVAAAALQFYTGYWSPWIVSEFVRKRTEWIADRAVHDGCNRAETRQRLRESRQRVNSLVDQFSRALKSVDYAAVLPELSWLADPDDWPVVQTAVAAEATVLVTDNSHDFPLGETRGGILILGSPHFLGRLYDQFPDAEAMVHEYITGAL